ncbi:unnamed protein product [Caenorhabditis sp. 36 PRJEB53466]|nr:unnamed protein product [Caenorhabditis sp. 36 PRJEB53466]
MFITEYTDRSAGVHLFSDSRNSDVSDSEESVELGVDDVQLLENLLQKVSESCASERFKKYLAPNIHRIDEFDLESRVKLLFASQTPIHEDFHEILAEMGAKIWLNADGTILEYRGGIHLTMRLDSQEHEDHPEPVPSTNFSRQDDTKMLKYLAERARKTRTPFEMKRFWKEYKKEGKSERTANGLSKRFRCHLAQTLHLRSGFSLSTRARMFLATSTPVPADFLETLRKRAKVEVNGKNVIVNYSKKTEKELEKEKEPELQIQKPMEPEPMIESSEPPHKEPVEVIEISDDDDDADVALVNPEMAWNPMAWDPQNLLFLDTNAAAPVPMELIPSALLSFPDFLAQNAPAMPVNWGDCTAGPAPSAETTSKKMFLHSLNYLVLSLDSPKLQRVKEAVNEEILKLGSGDERMSTEAIKSFVETSLEKLLGRRL